MGDLKQRWGDWHVSFTFRVLFLALTQGEIGFKVANLASPPVFGFESGWQSNSELAFSLFLGALTAHF